MPTINQLPTADTLQTDDLIPIYSSANGDARKASVNTFAELVADQVNELVVAPGNAVPQAPTPSGAAGIGIKYSREDHSHPSDAPEAANVAPADPAPAAVIGVSDRYAREDHAHESDAPTASTVVPSAPTTLGTIGISAEYARADHTHPSDAPVGSNATPQPPGLSGSPGGSAQFSRADHVHISDAPPPATATPLAASGSGAVGVATKYAREDHVHPSDGSGTVTSVSVVSANGLAGSVANATTTPAITLSTTISGVLKGNGTAISAATMGTDYSPPILAKDEGSTLTSAMTSINFTGAGVTATNSGNDVTVNIPGGGGSGTVTSVSVVSANGLAGTVANATTTPAITLTTSVTGILKGDGTAISAAVAGDFPTLNQNTTGTASNVTGTVAVANGGTGTTTLGAKGILFGNGTSAVGVTGAGTAGQVLTSNGAGVDPTFQTLSAGGGSVTLIASVTPTAAANIDIFGVVTSAYDSVIVIGENIAPQSSPSEINMRIATGASTVDSGATAYKIGTYTASSTTGASSITVTNTVHDAGNSGSSTFRIDIDGVGASIRRRIQCSSFDFNSSSAFVTKSSINGHDGAAALTGLRFFLGAGGNFNAAGKILVYGIKNT